MTEIEKKKEAYRKEMGDYAKAFRLLYAAGEATEAGEGALICEVLIEELQKIIPPNVMAASDSAAPTVCRFAGKNRYIGTKVVTAEPALRIEEGGNARVELLSTNPMPGPGAVVDLGYQVEYPDKHKSWCPQDVFEEAYRPADGLNFGLAMEAAKKGAKISRRGWNGKGQYVVLGTNFSYYVEGTDTRDAANHTDIGSTALVFAGTRGSQVGWLASQADMLADDWYIVEG